MVSSDIYTKNLSILEKRFPDFARIVESSIPTGTIALNKRGEINITAMGEFFFNQYSPVYEAEKRVEHFQKRSPDLLVAMGFSPLYHLAVLQKNFTGKKICVYEPMPGLAKTVLSSVDCSEIIDDPRFHITNYFKGIKEFFWMYYRAQYSLEIFALPFYQKFFASHVKYLVSLAQNETLQVRTNINTMESFSKYWVENSIKNLHAVSQSFDLLHIQNQFSGIPTAVVGAGPSLDPALDFISKHQDDLLIVAVDTAVKALKVKGITPHIVCILEWNELSWRTLADAGIADSVLLFTETSNPNVCTIPARNRISVFQNNIAPSNHFSRMLNKISVVTCGTVSSLAFNTAIISGGNPIFLFGQDLSFTKESKYSEFTHFGSKKVKKYVEELRQKDGDTLSLKEKLLINWNNIHWNYGTWETWGKVLHLFTADELAYLFDGFDANSAIRANLTCLDVNGNICHTTPGFKACAHWLSLRAQDLALECPELQLYNVSKGQKILGFTVISPHDHETLSSKILKKEKIFEKLDHALTEIPNSEMRVKEWVDKNIQEAKTLLEITEKGKISSNNVEKYLKNNDPRAHFWLEEVKKCNARLNEIMKDNNIWDYYFFKELNELEHPKGEKDPSPEAIVQASVEFYEHLHSGVVLLNRLLIETSKTH